MRQRWNDLLFAHWPVAPAAVAALLPSGLEPAGLEVDTFDGSAWLGVVPFWMDSVETRVAGERVIRVPGTATFPELNLRTYVRSRASGKSGVYFFSLDAASALAVVGARTLFHLPYYFAAMERRTGAAGETLYRSRRLLVREPVRFEASYRGLGRAPDARPSQPGSLAYFLTERYCLFTSFRSKLLIGEIHHLPWPLEPAEAEIRRNELALPHGLSLPDSPPVLHLSRQLEVYIWGLRADSGADSV